MDMASLSLCPRISFSTLHSQAGSSILAVQRFSMGGLGSGSERFSRLRSSGKLLRLSQASQKFRIRGLSMPRTSMAETCKEEQTYIPGPLDVIFLNVFRSKMVEEVGWDSSRPGYDGLIDVAKRLLLHYPSRQETEQATVRVLRSLFPSWLLTLFKQFIAPLGDGKLGAVLCARVTQATTQWLMGPCQLNEVQLADGSLLLSGVMVQKCKYLDGTKCAGICIHTCKLPTQAFITGDMGVALLIEPNYEDFSCQVFFALTHHKCFHHKQKVSLELPAKTYKHHTIHWMLAWHQFELEVAQGHCGSGSAVQVWNQGIACSTRPCIANRMPVYVPYCSFPV